MADLAELTEGSDDEIAGKLHEAGTEHVLDSIFEGMRERFQPEKAIGVDAQVQWLIGDDGAEYPYVVTVKDGTIATERGTAGDPKVTLTTNAVSFAKLMAGKAVGPQLYMTGKLKINGDLMLAQRLTTFFAT